jgi:mitochondrial fission protein ELM1
MADALDAAAGFAADARSRRVSIRHQIWLLDEGSGGHRVQSEGVLKALRTAGVPMEIAHIRVRPKLRGFLRGPARRLFRHLRQGTALRFANLIAEFTLPDTPPPKFIISSGGSTAFVSRALSLWYSAANVFVGNPKPFPAEWFRIVMSPVPLTAIPDAILTEIVPNNVTPADCRDKALEYWAGRAVPDQCWAMLIGGANRNNLFSTEDWSAMARGMNHLADKYGIKWLVTTSRRSGVEAERIFKSVLVPEAVEELVIQSEDSRPIILPYLGAGAMVFVTQDSLTMLSEAISSGKPVVAVTPARIELAPDNFMAVMLRQYRSFEHFSAIQASHLSRFELKPGTRCTNALAEEAMAAAAERLRAELAI